MAAFARALESDPSLATRVASACAVCAGEHRHHCTAAELFAKLDINGHGQLGQWELQRLARLQVMSSPLLYAIETVALGAIAVIGAQGGINRGMPPSVCVALSVTICSGGLMRDVLCNRDVALGSQSFALATAAGASVYVGLRHLSVRGYALPLGLRIVLGSGTAIAQRALAWRRENSGAEDLPPMANYYDLKADLNADGRPLTQHGQDHPHLPV